MGIRSFFNNLFGGNQETNTPQTPSAGKATPSLAARHAAFVQTIQVSPAQMNQNPDPAPKSHSDPRNEGGRERADDLTHTRNDDDKYGSNSPQDNTANTSTAPSIKNHSGISSSIATDSNDPSNVAPQIEGATSDAPGPESAGLTGGSFTSGEDGNSADNSNNNDGNDGGGGNEDNEGDSNDDGDGLG